MKKQIYQKDCNKMIMTKNKIFILLEIKKNYQRPKIKLVNLWGLKFNNYIIYTLK